MGSGESQSTDCAVRVVNVYATPWLFNGKLDDNEGTPDDLSVLEEYYTVFGEQYDLYEEYYKLYKKQLPQQLPDRLLGRRLRYYSVIFPDSGVLKGVDIQPAKVQLFTLPSKQVVLAVTLNLAGGVYVNEREDDPIVWVTDHIAEVLEQCIYGNIKLQCRDGENKVVDECEIEKALSDDFDELCSEVKLPSKDLFSKDINGDPLLPERHQLVFVARSGGEQSEENRRAMDKILYRRTPPYRPEFVNPRRPKQLNRQGSQEGVDDSVQEQILGVVTPYVSLLYGHQKYVEVSIFLSTVHAVGTAAQFHNIWRKAYHEVLTFREKDQKQVVGQQTRKELEKLADQLGNLEFDLTFSVEFPLLRIETFQSDLYEVMDLGNQANTLSRMFAQLDSSLRSEITAIEAREQQRAERFKRWNSFAAGLLSLIGVPVGFVIAFFGINTTEVPDGPPRADPSALNASDIPKPSTSPTSAPEPSKLSMWSDHYALLYLVASLFAVVPVFLIAYPYLREFAPSRKDRWVLWSGMAAVIVGIVIFIWALLSYLHLTDTAQVLGAIGISPSILLAVIGAILLVRWWRPEPKEDRSSPAESPAGSGTVTGRASGQ